MTTSLLSAFSSPALNPPRVPSGEADSATIFLQMVAQLSHADTSLRYYAAWWLGKFGRQAQVTPELRAQAVSALIEALADQADRTELGGYPLRRNAARALGKLGDLRAVSPLIACLACEDFYVREAAAQALGQLGDLVAIPPLLELLAGGVAAAQFVPGRPHLIQPYEAVLESLGQLQAKDAVPEIRPFLNHSMDRVKFAAARALCQLTGDAAAAELLIQALNSPDVQLRRSALLDLGATGYLPAASAIAGAAVENSFKLIALRGLVQGAMRVVDLSQSDFPPELTELLMLMDGLL
ncbi:HEAT repeat domain-containing protein [Thermosynechococcaceae cyanobacterium BACA0444]|uniref:HEAT repeat domain-containing protein n=1 Tax=Pseudocalidococcus azoricus BACA0444 TaxID=2918990 RepID=A0AAE4FUM2_9CYAN|nr:HEAT repeat domain-containing protein [Pseudocalidococcus azoricus]MDS3861261.1 HEAT repeat domain-containing protein [Pseudocalidococcus azoricus BACA0444]